jgi:hypothetical protein
VQPHPGSPGFAKKNDKPEILLDDFFFAINQRVCSVTRIFCAKNGLQIAEDYISRAVDCSFV